MLEEAGLGFAKKYTFDGIVKHDVVVIIVIGFVQQNDDVESPIVGFVQNYLFGYVVAISCLVYILRFHELVSQD